MHPNTARVGEAVLILPDAERDKAASHGGGRLGLVASLFFRGNGPSWQIVPALGAHFASR